jgi:hypothetical protein
MMPFVHLGVSAALSSKELGVARVHSAVLM